MGLRNVGKRLKNTAKSTKDLVQEAKDKGIKEAAGTLKENAKDVDVKKAALGYMTAGLSLAFTGIKKKKVLEINEDDNISTTETTYKKERFAIAGVSYRQDAIKSTLNKNEEYDLSIKELKKEFKEQQKIDREAFKEIGLDYDEEEFDLYAIEIYEYNRIISKNVTLLFETDNEYDKNAIAVIFKNTKIGYIKKDQTTRVKDLLSNPHEIQLSIYGGNHKVYDDESESLVIKEDLIKGSLTFYIKDE